MISKVQNETRTKIFKVMQDAEELNKTSQSLSIGANSNQNIIMLDEFGLHSLRFTR